ncbi:MAG: aminopeptidase P N-terminal domain-containing protein [bacterium]|nr:aminopeptidase P N-terminal domain-containing protein [bacterium]
MITSHLRITLTRLIIVLCTAISASAQFAYEMYDSDVTPANMHQQRRLKALALLSPRTALVVQAADIRNRQNDVDYEYRQNSDLLYLTGFMHAGGTLLLVPDGVKIGDRTFREVLFVRERVRQREQWTGVEMGPEEARSYLRIDTTLPASRLTEIINALVPRLDTLFTTTLPTKSVPLTLFGRRMSVDSQLQKELRERNASAVLVTTWTPLSAMREVKDTSELRLMQRAIDISIQGHLAAMRGVRPGMTEYQIEALMEFTFKNLGAEDVGYPSIVGSKYNACILHYITNRRKTTPNDLILADCGAEYHGYTADITRTFPMSGRFTQEQRRIYDIVLEAQDSGIAACRAGTKFRAPHEAAKSVIARHLLDLGIIDSVEQVSKYFMHGTSHYLGLDVHDPGTYGPLTPGVVLTVEPGIYIPAESKCDKKWWNIGVRIEDDILVTDGDPINMSVKLPRAATEIEALVGTQP